MEFGQLKFSEMERNRMNKHFETLNQNADAHGEHGRASL